MRLFLLVLALILFAFTLTSATGRAQQDAAPTSTPAPTASAAAKNPVKPTADSQARAKNLFEIDCAMCHGSSGDGKTDLAKDMQLTMLDWTDPKALAGKSDGDLFNIIRNGNNKMPPEVEGRAKDNEVWNLIIYIRAMSKGQTDAEAK
jgi:cytochrome c5